MKYQWKSFESRQTAEDTVPQPEAGRHGKKAASRTTQQPSEPADKSPEVIQKNLLAVRSASC